MNREPVGLALADVVELKPAPAQVTETPPPIAFSALERRAIGELVSGSEDVIGFTAGRARALAGDATGEVRTRGLARAVAVAEVQMQELQTLLAAAVGKRDADGARLLERVLTGATRRYTLLVAELREELEGRQRPVIVVNAGE